jgi:drug/metabolite transporter (DMT)-like permease
MDDARHEHDHKIWIYAFGYFACYAPYSALIKAMSSGFLAGLPKVSGFAMLPVSTCASMLGMFVFLTAMGWWKHAPRSRIFGVSVPRPELRTFVSGLCSGAIIGTTTLSYAVSGVSIVFMMLLMRGGVLVIAPIVDRVSGRKVRWFSWVALALSFGSLVAAFWGPHGSLKMSLVATLDVLVYLASYFVRLRFMSHGAKSTAANATTRYFVEEQMVATPSIVLVLAVVALVGGPGIAGEIREGFTKIPFSAALLPTLVVGVLSQGTGIFGGLILLDPRENTFCVPVNRASSVLAGIVASASLTIFFAQPSLPPKEIVGAALVIAAIVVLALPSLLGAKKRRLATT